MQQKYHNLRCNKNIIIFRNVFMFGRHDGMINSAGTVEFEIHEVPRNPKMLLEIIAARV